MKIRRGRGRAQFVSFNFPNNPIWASSQREICKSQPGRTRMGFPGDRHAFGVGSL
jgi:hypothetical protein